MENRIEKIMQNYKKELGKINNKYVVKEVKKPDTKELEDKIQYEKEFIAKLEFEAKELNAETIAKAKERLELAMSEKAGIDSKYQEDLLKRDKKVLEKTKLKNSRVVLESGREVSMEEKDKLDKADLKNKTIKELTSESRVISETLLAKKAELESKRKEWQEFQYKYEKDENGKLKPEPINADEVKKIRAEFDEIKKDMEELDKMQKQCQDYLAELKAPTKQDKEFMDAWNETAKEQESQEKQEKEENKKEQDEEHDEKSDEEREESNKEEQDKEHDEKSDEEREESNKEEQDEEREEENEVEKVKSININASSGKAIVITEQGEEEFLIEELIDNKKSIYERADLDKVLEDKGKKTLLSKAIFKRKVNPVILNALGSDREMVEEYIDSLMDNDKEFPFEYIHNLEGSTLSNKNTRFMNRIALKEQKIAGTEVAGAEKFYSVKKIFRDVKSKIKTLKEIKEPKKLPEAEKGKKSYNLRKDPTVVLDLGKIEAERNAKIQESYEKLTPEQKQELSKLTINTRMAEVQEKFGVSYNEAYGLVEKYGKKEKIENEGQVEK